MQLRLKIRKHNKSVRRQQDLEVSNKIRIQLDGDLSLVSQRLKSRTSKITVSKEALERLVGNSAWTRRKI